MLNSFVADTDLLPNGSPCYQLRAMCYLNEVNVIAKAATNIEPVAEYTARMKVSCNEEAWARAPFTCVYAVNFDGVQLFTFLPSSEEQVTLLVAS